MDVYPEMVNFTRTPFIAPVIPMPIDLKIWSASLEELAGTVLPKETHISNQPEDFFDGFFCENGFPYSADYYPIWYDSGVVVYVDFAQAFVFDLDGGRWKKYSDTACFRTFWISEAGILGEIDKKNGKTTEFFPVSSPHAAAEYIALICGKQLERGTRNNERVMALEDIISDRYVRFFRFPDDLSPKLNEMPWVSLRKLEGLVKQYVSQSVAWLDPFMAEFEALVRRKKIKDEPESAKTIRVGDSDEKISANEFLQWFSGTNQTELGLLRQACLKTAATIEEADLLDISAAWRLQMYQLPYGFVEGIPDFYIEVAILPANEVFPDYLSAKVNPSARQAIRMNVLMPLVDPKEMPAPARISLPSFPEQKRRAFEALAYRHAIDGKSNKLSQFQNGQESCSELHGLLANRYSEVSTILKRRPTYDVEIERVHFPLPYFIEAPLIAWERAPDNLKIQNGIMAFGSLLKQIVLLGLIELRACKKPINDFKPPPKDVIAGICADPSLGHWSKCLDWLGNYAGDLSIFAGWVRVLFEHRLQTIKINELRNKYVHSESVLERTFLEEIHQHLDGFFTDVVRQLRCEKGVRVMLPTSRRAIRREAEVAFEFFGFDLCSSYDRFRETSIELSTQESGKVIEGEIIAISSGDNPRLLSLLPFFRVKEVSLDQFGVLLYAKSFDGKSGVFNAVDSEAQSKLPMPDSPLALDSWEAIQPE